MEISGIVKVDSRGRILIPSTVRAGVGLAKGMYVMIHADTERREIKVVPLAGPKAKLVSFRMVISDVPGALAKVASIMAKHGVDLLASQSRTLERGRTAEWAAVGDVSGCKISLKSLKEALEEEGSAANVKLERLGRSPASS